MGLLEWSGHLGYQLGSWEVTITLNGKAVLCWVGTGAILVPDLFPVDMLDLTLKSFALMLEKVRCETGSSTQQANKLNCRRFLSLLNTLLSFII